MPGVWGYVLSSRLLSSRLLPQSSAGASSLSTASSSSSEPTARLQTSHKGLLTVRTMLGTSFSALKFQVGK